MKSFDVVVIGARNLGLTAATLLAASGKKVLVVEQYPASGGSATSFVRGRFEFNASPLGLCQAGSEDDSAEELINCAKDLLDAHDLSLENAETENPKFCESIKTIKELLRMNNTESSMAFDHLIHDLGGQIWYRSKVDKIDMEDDGLEIVTLYDGTRVSCEHVVSSLAPSAVFDRIVDQGKLSDWLGKSLVEHHDAKFPFSVYLGLDASAEELGLKAGTHKIEAKDKDNSGFFVTVESGTGPRSSDKGACIVYFTKFFEQDPFAKIEQSDYFNLKDQIALELIGQFEELTAINIRNHIEEAATASPSTWARRLGSRGGKSNKRMISGLGTMACDSFHLTKALHSPWQHVIVDSIKDIKGWVKIIRVKPNPAKGTDKLAFFRAGMHICLSMKIGDSVATRAYCMASSPLRAIDKDGFYEFSIFSIPAEFGGFMSDYIAKNVAEGTELEISSPRGGLCYTPVRDARKVIAVAIGSVAPFLSMAHAIVDGVEDFDLTILFEHMPEVAGMYFDELNELAEKSNGKVRVVHYLPEESREGYINARISADDVRKFAGDDDYSLFVISTGLPGDQSWEIIHDLDLPKRRWRKSPVGNMSAPKVVEELKAHGIEPEEGLSFKGTIVERDKEYDIDCAANETIVTAMERAGIVVPTSCRSGKCGVCRSRLIEGEVHIQESSDGRRAADKLNNWIHPCRTIPLSDFKLELPY